jgi:hypothetical protein
VRFTKKFSRLVDQDLKNKVPLTEADRAILDADLDGWIAVLKDFKAEVEVQFVYFKKEQAIKELAYAEGDITKTEMMKWMVEFMGRRLNAARLLKSIEAKLVSVKYERQRHTQRDLQRDTNDDQRGVVASTVEVSSLELST